MKKKDILALLSAFALSAITIFAFLCAGEIDVFNLFK